MRHCLVVFTLFLSASVARADGLDGDVMSVRLRADADSELEARVLVDRQTVGIWTRGIAFKTLRSSLGQLTQAQADFALLGDAETVAASGDNAESVVYLRFEQSVKEARASWRGGYWTLQLTGERLQSRLAERLAQSKLALPGGVDTGPLRQAEMRLAAGEWAGAQLAYQTLRDTYALSAWAALRLGDVALITGDVDGACDRWRQVDAVSPGRVAGTLGNLRARAMRCPKAVAPDWQTILMRRGRDDLVGQKLRDEARWSLLWETDAAALHQALAAGQQQLTTPLYELLWARLIRSSPPFEIVKLASRPDLPLWSHPEGVDLAWRIGRAWCALEVPLKAAQAMAHLPRKNWQALSAQTQRRMTRLIGSCRLGGAQAEIQQAAAIAAAKIDNPTTQLQARLGGIDARLRSVQQVLRSETALAQDDTP